MEWNKSNCLLYAGKIYIVVQDTVISDSSIPYTKEI